MGVSAITSQVFLSCCFTSAHNMFLLLEISPGFWWIWQRVLVSNSVTSLHVFWNSFLFNAYGISFSLHLYNSYESTGIAFIRWHYICFKNYKERKCLCGNSWFRSIWIYWIWLRTHKQLGVFYLLSSPSYFLDTSDCFDLAPNHHCQHLSHSLDNCKYKILDDLNCTKKIIKQEVISNHLKCVFFYNSVGTLWCHKSCLVYSLISRLIHCVPR